MQRNNHVSVGRSVDLVGKASPPGRMSHAWDKEPLGARSGAFFDYFVVTLGTRNP